MVFKLFKFTLYNLYKTTKTSEKYKLENIRKVENLSQNEYIKKLKSMKKYKTNDRAYTKISHDITWPHKQYLVFTDPLKGSFYLKATIIHKKLFRTCQDLPAISFHITSTKPNIFCKFTNCFIDLVFRFRRRWWYRRGWWQVVFKF